MAQEMPITLTGSKSEVSLMKQGIFRLILTAMRPHQWVKNFFVFAPLLFARKLTDASAIVNSLLAFAVFCLLASSLYIFNDWIDAEEDRNHPEKCHRPISSGLLPVSVALISAFVLVATGFGLSAILGLKFFLISALYVILTLSYCLALKRMILLDAMTISAGFVIRIVGGALAIGVLPTHWLIVCAFLLALFLAFTKRRQELLILSDSAVDHREVLDHYSVRYLDQVNNILISAVIVCYALYTVAPETVERFETTGLIYGTVFVIYGMLRYMMLIKNPNHGGNPSRMMFNDKPLLLTVTGWAIYNAIVIYHLTWKEFWLPFLQ